MNFYHLKVKHTDTALKTVSGFLNTITKSPLNASELLELGSIYVNKVRIFRDQKVKKEDYLRIHTNPKRYPPIDISQHTAFENDHLIIFNKPAGLPTHPTLDNYCENLLIQAKQQRQQNFFITHRLDTVTSGLLIFAKDFSFQKKINQLFEKQQIHKQYQALISSPTPQTGLLTHYMLKSSSSPKFLKKEHFPESQKCQLIIKGQRETKGYYELNIGLITGRTHQIRAQLSYLGVPIVGDSLYKSNESPSFLPPSSIALHCSHIGIPMTPDIRVSSAAPWKMS